MNTDPAGVRIDRYLLLSMIVGCLILMGTTGCDTDTSEWEPRVEPVVPETAPEIEPAEPAEPVEGQDDTPVFEFD